MNIAIVGLGSIGKRYYKNINSFFKNYQVFDYKFKKFIKNKKIDAAIISNPSSLHIKTATKLAEKNTHCLIEKPLSLNLKGIKKLQTITKSKKLNIQIGYNLRFMKGAKFFKNQFQNQKDKIIHISIRCLTNLVNWRKNKNYKKFSSANKKLSGGILFELSHEIDYLRWIFGDVLEVFATVKNTKKLRLDIEDIAKIFLRLKSGVTADINLSLVNDYEERKCEVITKKHNYSWNLLKDEIKKDNRFIFRNNKYDINHTQLEQLKNFFNTIKKKENPMVDLNDGIKTLKILLAIKKSSKMKKIIQL